MPPNTFFEPTEVRILKQKLACFTCKCVNCENYNKYNRLNKCKHNFGVQVDETNTGRFSQGQDTQEQQVDESNNRNKAIGTSFVSILCKDYICPSCRYIVDFLRGSLNRVLKDEECGTKPLQRCDKSTEKTVDILDKTTSLIKKCNSSSCAMKKQFPAEVLISDNNKKRNTEKVVFVDSEKDISEVSQKETNVGLEKAVSTDHDKYVFVDSEKDTGVSCQNETSEKANLKNPEKYTSFDAEETVDSEHKRERSKQFMCGTCVCVEKFINAIRPME